MRTIILADNQFITKEGIISIIKTSINTTYIEEANNVKELQVKLKEYADALVILDYTLFDFSSLHQLMIIKEKNPLSSWLLFSDELSEQFLRQLLIVDSSFSVIMKNASRTEVLAAIHESFNSKSYLCDFADKIMKREIITDIPKKDMLTASEKTILHEIALGKTTKEIAWEKNLSFHTVNSHRKNIFRKLQVNNVHEAVKYAIRSGIIDLMEYYI